MQPRRPRHSAKLRRLPRMAIRLSPVSDAARSVGRVGQSGSRPPSADTADAKVLKLGPSGTDIRPAGFGARFASRWRGLVGRTRASQPFCCSGGSVPGGASRSRGRATGQAVCGPAPGGTPSGETPIQRKG